MASTHEPDYQPRIRDAGPTRFLPESNVEIIREVRLDQPPRFALFDFDGTLSLIRAGWQQVMLPMLVESLAATGTSESQQSLEKLVINFVMELTGKQTIYQMLRLAEEIEKRGGTPEEPLVYKHRYHERLMQHISGRREALRTGEVPAESMLVPFSLEMLRELQNRGVKLYLASGTDEEYVREEARLLGIDAFFGQHIYGARDDYRNFSKSMVIQRILDDNDVDPSQLIGFGDGYVEIDNIKEAGGIAVGIASDESSPGGKPDLWKRDRLIGIGADVVIPDFRDYSVLCEYLWNSNGQ